MPIDPNTFLSRKNAKAYDKKCEKQVVSTAKAYDKVSSRDIQRHKRTIWDFVKGGMIIECDGVFLVNKLPSDTSVKEEISQIKEEMKILNANVQEIYDKVSDIKRKVDEVSS